MTAVKCGCGSMAELRENIHALSRWGLGPVVEFASDQWACPACKEVWYSPNMADKRTIALLKATVVALRIEVQEARVSGYKAGWGESGNTANHDYHAGLNDLLDTFESEVARQALTDFGVRSVELIRARARIVELFNRTDVII